MMTSDARKRLAENTIQPIEPSALTIKHPDGRDLLVFHLDGTVTGDVEEAPEAARVLVAEVRRLMGTPATSPTEREAGDVGEVAAVLAAHRLHASMNICTGCDWRADPYIGGSLVDQHEAHLADALAPLMAERERAAGAHSGVAIDAAHIAHQREWSTATFGPREQRGPLGPLAHIRKELVEVAEDPTVLEEWVDVIILAFDGAWRAGHEPQQIIDAVKAKQAKNEAREWPDWHGVAEDAAIEHVRHDFAACPLPDVKCLNGRPHEPHDWNSLTHRWCCPGRKDGAS